MRLGCLRRRGCLLKSLTTVFLAGIVLLAVPSSAWAHGGEESDRSYDLVRQAIALIVNAPGDDDAIMDKIKDAQEAKDTSQVNLPLVHQAQDAFDRHDLRQTRTLLESAIGARLFTGRGEPVAIGRPAGPVGEDTGTIVAADPIPGRHGLRGGDWLMLVLSLAVTAAGIVLAAALRPHTIASRSGGEPS